MQKALWYGWALGAPLSPAMEAVFKAKRGLTRTVLCCFHVATRLSQGKAALEQRAALGAMGRVPVDMVEQILMLAELEIPELLRRPLPRASRKVKNPDPFCPSAFWECAPFPPSAG